MEEVSASVREIEERAREVQGLCDEMRGRSDTPPREAHEVLSELQVAVSAAQESGNRAQLAIQKAAALLRGFDPSLGP